MLSPANGWRVSSYSSPNQRSNGLQSHQHHDCDSASFRITGTNILCSEKFKLNLSSERDDSARLFLCKWWESYCNRNWHPLETEESLIKRLCMTLFFVYMCGILFPKLAPIYKTSVSDLALISCRLHKCRDR